MHVLSHSRSSREDILLNTSSDERVESTNAPWRLLSELGRAHSKALSQQRVDTGTVSVRKRRARQGIEPESFASAVTHATHTTDWQSQTQAINLVQIHMLHINGRSMRCDCRMRQRCEEKARALQSSRPMQRKGIPPTSIVFSPEGIFRVTLKAITWRELRPRTTGEDRAAKVFRTPFVETAPRDKVVQASAILIFCDETDNGI